MSCKVTQPVQRTPLLPASWLPAIDKSQEVLSRLRFKESGSVYDERIAIYVSPDDALAPG